jgi:hypothetical protein
LLRQTQQTRFRQVGTRLHHVESFACATLILAQLIMSARLIV